MAKTFYLRLAGTNLLRGRRMYGPYVVAVALMSGMCFIILNLVLSQSIANLSYGPTVQAMFTIGIVVMVLFTVGYMLYINSFLIKRRKKEFGLYGVLGMERRHVAHVIVWESLMLGLGSLLLGLVGGAVFGRLAFLLLMNILDTAKGSTFVLDGSALLLTVAIFAGIFVLTTLYNLNQVRLASPVDLLKDEHKGEKKSRFAIPMALLGFALLGVAYYIAITSNNSAVSLMAFWPTVILVILATWLLFTGGSAVILRLLQKNRALYYRPRNFITISGLRHRMKQNAAGLANICILATMVMVTVSCCCALYFGHESIARRQSPDDFLLEARFDDIAMERDVLDKTYQTAAELAAREGLAVTDPIIYRFLRANVIVRGDTLIYRGPDGFDHSYEDDPFVVSHSANVVPLSDYNAVTGSHETLADGEVLLLSSDTSLHMLEVPTPDGPLSVKKLLHDTPLTQGKNHPYEYTLYLIVPDDFVLEMAHIINPTQEPAHTFTRMTFNLDADPDTGFDIAVAVRAAYRALGQETSAAHEGNAFSYTMSSLYENRIDGYSFYGGLLFLGVFFSLLFLINTVLILYFKQISEGFEDNERFVILRNIGLSDQEVRSTINRQMLIVFLAPLAMALLHILAASNMIRMMLVTFMLTDFRLTLLCIFFTSVVFIAVYLVVYRLTARTYYRIVTSRVA